MWLTIHIDDILLLQKEGLAPLHIASAIRGPEGVEISRLLLEAGAYPNSRASDKDLEDDLVRHRKQ